MENITKIYNFSAGPAMIPQEVLYQAQKELYNWNNLGISVMEISHRSDNFTQIVNELTLDLRILLKIPDNYHILFCHGGARGQFSAIPLNLVHSICNNNADYINSGYWSYNAAIEAKKFCLPNIINVKKINEESNEYISAMDNWNINYDSSYLHYCPNETIHGIAIHEEPNFNSKSIKVIGDFSSTLLSRNININKYSLIYASSQKNIGPSGVTIIIIQDELLNSAKYCLPSILNYQILLKNNSMFNTPNTFSLYLSGLVLKWIKKLGGIKNIEKRNIKKSNLLYKMIDSTDFYVNNVIKNNRSLMNVPFRIIDSKLHELFLKESHNHGLYFLKGHSVVGGIRASIYNAMPIEGVLKLVNFMKAFQKKYG